VLAWLCWRGCAGVAVLAWLCWRGCAGVAVLAWLCWRGRNERPCSEPGLVVVLDRQQTVRRAFLAIPVTFPECTL
jgi:hypothetical protein